MLGFLFISGFFISLPVFIWNMYKFLAPGLHKKEKQVILSYMIVSPALFMCGVLFVYYIVCPAAWDFFVGYESSNSNDANIKLLPSMSDYLDLITHLMIAFGVAFQTPVIIMFLAHLNVISHKSLIKKRRLAIVNNVYTWCNFNPSRCRKSAVHGWTFDLTI